MDIYIEILLHGWRTGPPGAPTVFETELGWVLSGSSRQDTPTEQTNLHAMPPSLICQVMPSSINSGKWRRLPLALHFQWRNVLLCNTSMPTITATLKEDSLYPCPRNQMQELLGSHGPKPLIASRHWRDH